MKKTFFTVWTIAGIIMLSFFLYSLNYYASLNSDIAVKVLMTYYFKLPQDLYYWGEDRWGSLIPLLSQFPLKVLNLRPITAVSITYYALFITGYIGFCSLFKTHFGRILFSLIFFLPVLYFVDVIWYVTGIQYSLIGISILLIKRLDITKNGNLQIKNYLLLIALIIIYVMAAWVSDAALFSIFLLVTVNIIYHWKEIRIKAMLAGFAAAGVLTGIFFIRFAKESVLKKNENFWGINDFSSIVQSLQTIKTAFANALSFRKGEELLSVYVLLVLAVFTFIIVLLIQNKSRISRNTKKWITFFILDALCIVALALLSEWVFLNGTNRRYFVGVYISLSLAMILITENLVLACNKQIALRTIMLITAIAGSLSTPYYFKFMWPKTLVPQAKAFEEFRQLGKAGILAEYWHSYITSCPDPSMIVASPEENDLVRNRWLAELVFAQPNIYVIRNDWMNSFPDTLNQFGRQLLKTGNEFMINGCNICKYEVINTQ